MQPLVIRKATSDDQGVIWEILQNAIELRRLQGSSQWQNGYPNPQIVEHDIANEYGHVFTLETGEIVAYAAIIKNDEPAYDTIDGAWLTDGDFFVIHRVAVAKNHLGKGFSVEVFKTIEAFSKTQKIPSIKLDTNYDNHGLLHVLEKLNYQYCGEVSIRNANRKAFQKVL